MPMTAREIISEYTKGRLCGRPEFYSGRGACRSDLNSDILEQLYQGILKEHGEKAAKQYALMVQAIDVLSATFFLNSLYALESNKWILSKPKARTEAMDHIDVTPDDGDMGKRVASGMAGVMAWTTGGAERDDTFMIRGEFLQKHGLEQKMPRIMDEWLKTFPEEKKG